MKDNKIHIAYGFHVNCYHSYRGDTNDNLGFGSDIRIMRKTIDILNKFNEQGIPVKGTWDTENFFSLEKILPEYAPDIIEGMKRRVEKYGDENIIMGYNNGALSAMTEDEFCASVELAVTNPAGSGLADIFGKCEKIVRPQEVMFTPSQVSLYNKLGVKALCLYYSCVPFDAFRTIVPKLPDEIAFNPVTYTYKGESMTIIPTYSNSDVCDAGCLRAWVKELHAKQERGEINSDLFIFINMDADGMFWETMGLGPLTGKIANTDGIHGLVKEIADLPYIVYDTPGGYLKNHKPIGNIEFTQDTADGNFTGYASWSEKPFNRKIWTSLERARAMARLNSGRDKDSPSFNDRVLLLSTTHFGLATPVLNIQREKAALELAEKVVSAERKALPQSEKITVYNITNSDFQCVQLKLRENAESISKLAVRGQGLADWALVPMDGDNSTVFALLRFKEISDKYEIELVKNGRPRKREFSNVVSSKKLTMKFSVHGNLFEVSSDGKILGDEGFFKSFITYGKKDYYFENKTVSPLDCAGSAEGLRIGGEIHLPNEIHGGSFEYDFFTVKSSNAIFARTSVQYPYTPEKTSISTENSSLGRFSDMSWIQAAPLQITPKLTGDISVVKRNFMDDISSFRTQSFPECDEKNDSLASFNHQLTGGIVGLTDENGGIMFVNARQVLNSMAHCPMRLEKDKTVRMNPFGTYYGKQRHHWGRAKDEILATYTLVTPQGKSIAPSYNGNAETAMTAFYAVDSPMPGDKELAEMKAFADGAVVCAPDGAAAQAFYGDNVKIKEPNADGISEKNLKNPILTGISGNVMNYVTKGSRAIGHIIKKQLKSRG